MRVKLGLAIGVLLLTHTAGAQVSVKVSADDASGACPVAVQFHAQIIVPGPVALQYQWLRSDGAAVAPQVTKYPGAGTYTLDTSWQLGAPTQGWMSLAILGPIKVESNQAAFVVTCGDSKPAIAPQTSLPPVLQSPKLAPKSVPPGNTPTYNLGNLSTVPERVNPIDPTEVGGLVSQTHIDNRPAVVVVDNHLAYIGTAGSAAEPTLYIFDVRNPRSPLLRSTLAIHGNLASGQLGVSAITVSGGFAYVALLAINDLCELAIVDIRDPARPQQMSTTAVVGSNGLNSPQFSLPVFGNYLYFSGTIFDISNPRTPTIASRQIGYSHSQAVYEITRGDEYPQALRGHYVYLYELASGYPWGLITWDVTDARHPLRLGLPLHLGAEGGIRLIEVKLYAGKLYVTGEGEGLYILTPLSSPRLEGRFAGLSGLPRMLGLDTGGFLYTLDMAAEVFACVDVRDAHHPVGTFIDIPAAEDRGQQVFGVLSGDYAYIVNPDASDLRIRRMR